MTGRLNTFPLHPVLLTFLLDAGRSNGDSRTARGGPRMPSPSLNLPSFFLKISTDVAFKLSVAAARGGFMEVKLWAIKEISSDKGN